MHDVLHSCVRLRAPSFKFFKVALSSLMLSGLSACGYVDLSNFQNNEEPELSTQEQLLNDLNRNQLIWSQSGVSEYSFELARDCEDCPDDLKTQQKISVSAKATQEDDEPTTGKMHKASLRDGEGDRGRNSTQNLRVESIFTDLRQAIQQNSVQQITYDPTYGYPQSVLLNTLGNPNSSLVRALADDDDNNFRSSTPVSNLAIQTRNFQVLNRANTAQNLTLNGQFIRQTNPQTSIDEYWLVENSGRWNQLSVPTRINPTLANLNNQTFVQATGNWTPGGINGQGLFNLQQITANQNSPLRNNLNGTLYYSVANNDDYDLDDFYITNSAGRNIFLNVPSDLRSRALSLAGRQVNLQGNWNGSFGQPNARFFPTQFTPANSTLQRFTGILSPGTAYQIPGVQQSNYVLVSDLGAVFEVQIPANLVNTIAFSIGQRVDVYGTQVYSGSFGQPVILAQAITPVQNVYTNTQLSGVITSLTASGGFTVNDMITLQTDTGSTVSVQIPASFRSNGYPLAVGMRILVNGTWISSQVFGQGVFEARSPVQIVDFGYNQTTSYSGFISNVGAIGNGVVCNGTQNVYLFTTDTGQTFQLYINNTSAITGLNGLNNIPYQARVQVTGTVVSPGVMQAQSVYVQPQADTSIVGTVIEIGPVGGGFACSNTLYTYRLLDQFGNAYSITTTANSIIQGSFGNSYLAIGDNVQVLGTLSGDGTSFYARQISVLNYPIVAPGQAFAGPLPFPSPYIPQPNLATVSVMGTVTGLDCGIGGTTGLGGNYIFVDNSGALYKLRVNQAQTSGALQINVGTQLQVTGSVVNNELIAQTVSPVATFADPVNRIPISGTIVSLISSTSTTCGVNTYQFQADTGQYYQLRLTNDAAQRNQQLANNTRITVVSRVSGNNPQLIDALQIQYLTNGQPFNFGNFNQTVSMIGTITATGTGGTFGSTSCNNEVYFVDQQTGTGFPMQLPVTSSIITPTVGMTIGVSGNFAGNSLVANSVYPVGQGQVVLPSPQPVSGTISTQLNTETLSCGVTITTYSFQSDTTGRVQRLRVASNILGGQYLTAGSRVYVTNRVESLDGSVIDALAISQQGFGFF